MVTELPCCDLDLVAHILGRSKCVNFPFRRMGRRKSKRKPPPKRKAIEPLDIQFNCPFCNHEKSCEVKM